MVGKNIVNYVENDVQLWKDNFGIFGDVEKDNKFEGIV